MRNAPANSGGSDSSGDERWMQLALAQAQVAASQGEVPVGAVVVDAQGQLLATGHNSPIATHDPTAHAELVALRAAAKALGNYRLDGCTLYVTLEPCAMCSGAMLHARLARVVFGAADAKTGAAGSVLNLFSMPTLNHHTQVQGGVLPQACAHALKAFFAPRRANTNPLREDALRTPNARFASLPPLPGASQWVAHLPALAGLRMHYLDEAPTAASPPPASLTNQAHGTTHAPALDSAPITVLCLHTAEGWAWDYRHVMPALAAHGLRVVVPDLIGFGHSDKPKKEHMHTLAWHAQALQSLLSHLGVQRVLLVLPAHGAVAAVGATLVAALQHTGAASCAGALCWSELPSQPLPTAAGKSASKSRRRTAPLPPFSPPAYDAPFPDKGYRAAPRAFARLAPTDTAVTTESPMNLLPSLAKPTQLQADLHTPEGGHALAQQVVQWLQNSGHWS